MPSLLVTNDFPPKVGGIQSYLGELWRRFPPGEVTVLTTSHPSAAAFDADLPFRIERARARVLLPSPALARRIDDLAREIGAAVIFIDPVVPLGLVARWVRVAPVVIIVHGAEVTVPGRLPGGRQSVRSVLRAAAGIVAAGRYPAAEAVRAAGRPLAGIVVPPGVDSERFRPFDDVARASTRRRLGLDPKRPMVVGLSRLVPRKGFDVLIDAVARLDAGVQLAIGGTGRDRHRLERRARRHGLDHRVRFLGGVALDDLPAVYGCADIFAMLCRDRWAGLEQEGFGIVFVEAAACGVAAVAGRSGGSDEAVIDGETGYVVEPRDPGAVTDALGRLLGDAALRARFGAAARQRAASALNYDTLAARLAPLASGDLGVLGPLEASL